MAFLTDRKRAIGMGSARSGTDHFWSMTVSSVALLILVPLFIFMVGSTIGEDYADVRARFARPFPALVTVLTLIVGFHHFAMGARVLIEDYTGGLTRKLCIIAVQCISYAAIAASIYAIVRIAL